MDWHGRRILSGYGMAHLPITSGLHKIEVAIWRPVGSPTQELNAYLLGSTPALLNDKPIHESAWKDRCRLVTVSVGKVNIELFVVSRFLSSQGVDIVNKTQ